MRGRVNIGGDLGEENLVKSIAKCMDLREGNGNGF